MIKRTMMRLAVIGCLVVAIVLAAGCGASERSSGVSIGQVGSHGPGYARYRYETLDGWRSWALGGEEGDTLVLTYEVSVSKGSLALSVEDPSGDALWSIDLEEDAADTIEVVLPETGRYRIMVTGESAGGSYDLSWEMDA